MANKTQLPRRREPVTAWATPAEKAVIVAEAEHEGKSMSAFVRSILLAAVQRRRARRGDQ